MHVLVLGSYGLIGSEIAAELVRQGHAITGLGRAARARRSTAPASRWIAADIATLLAPEDWSSHLVGVDAVVNAAGALQTGLRDDLGKLQRDAIRALIAACEKSGVKKFIQVSAPGASPTASTEFMRTKGQADDALRASALDWVILKPALVLSPNAYGGTSLLRALAAFPFLQPIVLADARVQTIDVADVARAGVRALADPALARQTFDLAEPQSHALLAVVLAIRRWLGFPEPLAVLRMPRTIATATSAIADLAGHLGWRSPLRSTAITVMAADVIADPEPWHAATGERFASLEQTLLRLPSTRQERGFARMELAFPLLVVLFAGFWIASGLIGIASFEPAKAVISERTGEPLASLAVVGGALLDTAIGCALLIRRTFRNACLAAIALSLIYLVGGSVLTPHLWADPLGPLLKILPVIGLGLALAAYAEER